MKVVEVFGELGYALSIRLSFEAETLGLEEGLELFIVGNDAIVDDREFPARVRSGCCQFYLASLRERDVKTESSLPTCGDGSSI